MINKKQIAVIYTHFPHYRSALFCELENSGKFYFKFYYDPKGVDADIKNGDKKFNHNFLKTYLYK